MFWRRVRSIAATAFVVLTLGSVAAAFVATSQAWVRTSSDQDIASTARLMSPNERVAQAFGRWDGSRR